MAPSTPICSHDSSPLVPIPTGLRPPTYRLTLAYDGTHFFGWQRQPGARTVQGELERALSEITREKIVCMASGRTDSGVHALAQVVGFETNSQIPLPLLTKGVNSQLPADIMVFEIEPAPRSFHAIRDAVRKRYRYVVQDGRVRDVFERQYAWQVYQRLDIEAMQRAALALLGTHDFKSYETTGSCRLTTIRTVYDILVERVPGERTDRVWIEVEADGFLYNMVRNIAGTLVQIGRGKAPESFTSDALVALDRRAAGVTAPPHGLYMLWVDYDGTPAIPDEIIDDETAAL